MIELSKEGSVYCIVLAGKIVESWDSTGLFCQRFAESLVCYFDNKSLCLDWLVRYFADESIYDPRNYDRDITYQTPTIDGRLEHADGTECTDPYEPLDPHHALLDLVNILV